MSSHARRIPSELPGEVVNDLGEIVASLVFSRGEAWEKIMRLHVRPRPAWCPELLWSRVVNLVLIQSEQGRR